VRLDIVPFNPVAVTAYKRLEMLKVRDKLAQGRVPLTRTTMWEGLESPRIAHFIMGCGRAANPYTVWDNPDPDNVLVAFYSTVHRPAQNAYMRMREAVFEPGRFVWNGPDPWATGPPQVAVEPTAVRHQTPDPCLDSTLPLAVVLVWDRNVHGTEIPPNLPLHVRNKAEQVAAVIPGVTFETETLRDRTCNYDPFLVVRYGNERYYIEVWDEPAFEKQL
jgi:hypothetical protein